jgi:hypothetical protein
VTGFDAVEAQQHIAEAREQALRLRSEGHEWSGKTAQIFFTTHDDMTALASNLELAVAEVARLTNGLDALAHEAITKGEKLQEVRELRLVGNAYVGMGSRIHAILLGSTEPEKEN